jgi:hypothetical protein
MGDIPEHFSDAYRIRAPTYLVDATLSLSLPWALENEEEEEEEEEKRKIERKREPISRRRR